MNAIQRMSMLAGGAALALMLGGCNSGDPNCGTNPSGPGCPPSPTPSPTPRPAVVIDRGEGSLPELTVLLRPVSITETGAFDATVDWTFAANDVDVFLARGNCSFEQFVQDQCAIAAGSMSTTAKPERIRLANQPAGTYTLGVVNFGPGDESVAYQLVFTPGTAAASASDSVQGVRAWPTKARLKGETHFE
jgi:hypothetical protein